MFKTYLAFHIAGKLRDIDHPVRGFTAPGDWTDRVSIAFHAMFIAQLFRKSILIPVQPEMQGFRFLVDIDRQRFALIKSQQHIGTQVCKAEGF